MGRRLGLVVTVGFVAQCDDFAWGGAAWSTVNAYKIYVVVLLLYGGETCLYFCSWPCLPVVGTRVFVRGPGSGEPVSIGLLLVVAHR